MALDLTDRREAMKKVERAMSIAREAEATASTLSRRAFSQIAGQVARIRKALHRSEGIDLEDARRALAAIEELLGLAPQVDEFSDTSGEEAALTNISAVFDHDEGDRNA